MKFTRSYILILLEVILLSGCTKAEIERRNEQQLRSKFDSSTDAQARKICFELGGTRFEVGSSGGSSHAVCVFERLGENEW